jgi:predicted ATP-dependent endonuclease of OLD family
MHVQSFRVRNFRRLKNAKIDLDAETSVFVGANNSGKTSATHIFQLFLGASKGLFSIHDFSSDCWRKFNELGSSDQGPNASLPQISLDIWFDVDDSNLHRVVDFLPGLDWSSEPIGVRLAFEPKDADLLLSRYREARESRKENPDSPTYKPWPENLTDYLKKRLGVEYEIRYYVLDSRHFDANLEDLPGFAPRPLGNAQSGASKILETILRVDFLDAQRNLADSEIRGRSEDLSKRLSRYYARHLQKQEEDVRALTAISDAEHKLNDHFTDAFSSILSSLSELGYPGIGNHDLVIKADFNPSVILSGNAYVHYALPTEPGSSVSSTLPDRYNGLGFKNLIFMAIEILDFHEAWSSVEQNRPPVHLVMIEEPESHLHAQLQQVFIRKIHDVLPKPADGFQTQLVVTTHSSHIIYETTLRNIRYFRRTISGDSHQSDVRNLSRFYNDEEVATRDFLLQYLKLTHCDLFFADAALLVEGNVERLLLPLMIKVVSPKLQSSHLTILEVGGAYAHKFDKLIQFLALPTLVITDIDSVESAAKDSYDPSDIDDPSGADEEFGGSGKTCMTNVPGAVTSNQTLRSWTPKIVEIAKLLEASDDKKIAVDADGQAREVRVAYQTGATIEWGGSTMTLAGRTLEEEFAFANLAWIQGDARKHLGLHIRGAVDMSIEDLARRIHKRVRVFDKTKFALGLMTEDPNAWTTPGYIREGLQWLEDLLKPPAIQAGGPHADGPVVE